ncbi:MAG: acetate--CoA ligase family protein [Archaeoglobaceae archaeon]|nr:acetate--CoA ligase family protein [Archaeoglobaceae archaeon]
MLLIEEEAKELLEKYGIITVKGYVCESEEKAIGIAKEIGFPVVMKVHGIVHKSDVGGVILDIRNEEEVKNAFRKLIKIEGAKGVNVQPMISGIELIIGSADNEQFGSYIIFGLGGIFTEILRDISLRLVPISRRDAEDMIREIRGYKILEGYRGIKANVEAIVELLLKVSELVEKEEIVEMDLNPVFANEKGCFVADARILIGKKRIFDFEKREISFFFNPKSVAVIGASRSIGKPGNNIVWNLKKYGFKENIYPVNPNAREIHGFKCYPSIKDVPEDVDVAIIAVPAKIVPEIMKDCADKGVKGVVVVSSGFSEEGEKGAIFEREMLKIAKSSGILIFGPNTTGVMNTETGFITSFAPLRSVKMGNISIVAQTGLFLGVMMESIASNEPGIGFSKLIGMGNKIDVQDHEVLEYLLRDEKTKVVGMYIEGFRNGRAFFQVARNSSKPIVVFKSGRSEYGKKAAMSHTASIGGNDEIFDSLCKQANLIRVFSFDELLNITKALSMQPLPLGDKVAVIHYTGSGCVQSADAVNFSGLKLANLSKMTKERIRDVTPEWHAINNPLDIWPMVEYHGMEKPYEVAIDAMLRDENVDSLVVVLWSSVLWKSYVPDFGELRNFVKPVYFVAEGPREEVYALKMEYETNGFPLYPNAIAAIEVLGKVTNFAMRYDRRRS